MTGGERTIVVRSPYDGRVVGEVFSATQSDIDAAVATALGRHRAGAPEAFERARILDKAADSLLDPTTAERFALSIAREAAKPITSARIEVARAADTFRFAATVARTLTGETVPLDASSAAAGSGKLGFVLRVPIGVVAAITPFNFPLNLVAHKVAPAIAAGSPVVLKPASATPLTAFALRDLLVGNCGLPDDMLSVLACPGSVAEHLVTHRDVSMITFTGSPDVGWAIRAKAPRKRVGLELGNNAPVIVEPDAAIESVAAKISVAGYAYAGQTCISVQRVFVHESVMDEFVRELVARVEKLHVGDPLDDSTDVSALINPGETNRVMRSIDAAVESGAKIACGGTLTDGNMLLPTVLTGVTPEMDVCATEIFGPVVGVASYSHFDEALCLANETRYGLQASVFTSDLGKALDAARKLEFGGVLINEVPSWRADQMPYGGVRDSGNTREGPKYAALEMTEARLVIMEPPS
ncbi:MAG: aldehyde dehydrogenase [Acidobacteria bacterium]|nr:MAG: aldehyde dehydrogenase [Acidobacteriota bacterium]